MIDARYLNGQSSGIGRYTRRLIENMLAIDPGLRLELITCPSNPRPVVHERVRCQVVLSTEPNSLWTRFALRHRVDFAGVDLFHSPFNILPARLPVPAVLTLHDIMWLLDSRYCTDTLWRRAIIGTFYKTFIPRSAREAARILTVSEHSRRAIEERFPEKRGLVEKTYHGIDPFFCPVAATEAWPLIAGHVPPGKQFVLVVGQGSPYKNHAGALAGFIEAFADSAEQIYFVLIRRFNRSNDPLLRRLMADRRVRDRLVHLSYVRSEELRAFYSLARVFLFPSLYEGFGMPALEAMACGTPVIASNIGAPAEVVGDAALTVDPGDTWQIAAALRAVCLDDELHARYRAAGLLRAQAFTWRRCAEQTLRVYRQVLGATSRPGDT